MESTFKTEVAEVRQPDGSIDITFKASGRSVHDTGVGQFGTIVFGVISLLIGLLLLIFTLFGLVFVGLAVFFFAVAKIYRVKLSSITIVPNEGIRWGTHKLPLEDIEERGVTTLTNNSTTRGYRESAYIYVRSGGREIHVTKYMPEARAKSVNQLIDNYLYSSQAAPDGIVSQ